MNTEKMSGSGLPAFLLEKLEKQIAGHQELGEYILARYKDLSDQEDMASNLGEDVMRYMMDQEGKLAYIEWLRQSMGMEIRAYHKDHTNEWYLTWDAWQPLMGKEGLGGCILSHKEYADFLASKPSHVRVVEGEKMPF